MAGRKASLIQDIEDALTYSKNGSKKSVQRRSYTLRRLPDELIKMKCLVPSLSALNSNLVKKLVEYWVHKGDRPKTIYNKVSDLRNVIQKKYNAMEFPSNVMLGIHCVQVPKLLPSIAYENIKLHSMDNAIKHLNVVCGLQYFFGLKKSEATQFRPYMLRPHCINVPRSISYNHIDRVIEVSTQKQTEFINTINKESLTYNTADQQYRKLLTLMHGHALKLIGVDEPEHYRYQYVLWRYNQLKESNSLDLMQCYQQLRQELGYRENRQIKELLICLENS